MENFKPVFQPPPLVPWKDAKWPVPARVKIEVIEISVKYVVIRGDTLYSFEVAVQVQVHVVGCILDCRLFRAHI